MQEKSVIETSRRLSNQSPKSLKQPSLSPFIAKEGRNNDEEVKLDESIMDISFIQNVEVAYPMVA